MAFEGPGYDAGGDLGVICSVRLLAAIDSSAHLNP